MVTEDTILSIPQHPERPSLDILPTSDEVQRVTMQMKKQKACGPDVIPAEIFKCGGDNLASKLNELICNSWQDEQISEMPISLLSTKKELNQTVGTTEALSFFQ